MSGYLLPHQLSDFINSSDGRPDLLKHLIRESGKKVSRILLEEEGLPLEEIQSLAEFITSDTMPGGKNRKKFTRKPRKFRTTRRRSIPISLRGYTVPFRHTYLWSDMSGSKGKWYLNLKIKALISEYVKTFDEFKIKNLTLHYKPNNNTSATGIYSSVLLDQNGFGANSGGTEKGWFRTLATMPGAKVLHRNVDCVHRWRPTEASSNNWHRPTVDTDYSIATIYFADNGQETVELGGVLMITGHLLVRGLFWNAPVSIRQRAAIELVNQAIDNEDYQMIEGTDQLRM